MRILTEEERIKIDSSEETLKKWKDFLPTAVENLGYKEETYTNLFPYDEATFYAIDPEKDVPKINKQSGRLIFKRSMADKLEMWLGIGRINNPTIHTAPNNQQLYLLNFIGEVFKTMADRNSKEYAANVYLTAQRLNEEGVAEVGNLPIEKYQTMYIQPEFVIKDNFFTDEEEKWFDKNIGISDICAMVSIWEDINTSGSNNKVPVDLLQAMARHGEKTASLPYIQTCFENYLVISMNPSDKLLCSTKQAFTSCMSIMANDRPVGKQQGPCYGIPALMDNEGVWTLFLTAGCHKNFYFDSEQWMKAGEERDKNQAFRYMKMTARAFAYDGVPVTTPALPSDNVDRLAERLFPRMYIGRLFSQMDCYSRSIGSVFETLVSKELAKFNIKTSINEGHRMIEEFTGGIRNFPSDVSNNFGKTVGYITWPMFASYDLCPAADKEVLAPLFKETNRENSVSYQGKYPAMKIDHTKFKDASLGVSTQFSAISSKILNPVTVGYLVNPNVRADDIFEQTNSIYFDNIAPACYSTGGLPRLALRTSHPMYNYPMVFTNISSTGCGQLQNIQHTHQADFMKLMLGKQKVTEVCAESKICDKCGKVCSSNRTYKVQIPNPDVAPGSPNDTLIIDICYDCLQELQDKELVKFCEGCNIYYMAELEYKHTIVDFLAELKQKLIEAYPQYVPNEQEITFKNSVVSYYTGGSGALRLDLRKMCQSAVQALGNDYHIKAYFCIACKQINIELVCGDSVGSTQWDFLSLKTDTVDTKLGTVMIDVSVHKYKTSCFKKVKICSKCHKIIIQSDWNEPLLLMPNGRVICKDCLDKIRLKNKDRELIVDAIKEHLGGNKEYSKNKPMSLNAAQLVNAHFKDVAKQIKSFAKNTDLSTLLADCTDDEKKMLNAVRAALQIIQQQLRKEEEEALAEQEKETAEEDILDELFEEVDVQ